MKSREVLRRYYGPEARLIRKITANVSGAVPIPETANQTQTDAENVEDLVLLRFLGLLNDDGERD